MFEWQNKGGNPNRANGQKIILECLQDIQKSNFTSVKSEPPQTDKLYELAIERYGNDVHLYAQQRDGFVEGYAQAIRNLAPIVNPTPSVKSESAEDKQEKYLKHLQKCIEDDDYAKLHYNPNKQIKVESAEEVKQSLEKKARDWEFQNRESGDSDYHSYRAGYNQAMHDFANNSEAMKENAIGFLEWYSMNRYYQMASSGMHTKIGDKNIYTENKLYTIYKESKFASFN